MRKYAFGEPMKTPQSDSVMRDSIAEGFEVWMTSIRPHLPVQSGVFFVSDAEGVVLSLYGINSESDILEHSGIAMGTRLVGLNDTEIGEKTRFQLVPMHREDKMEIGLATVDETSQAPVCVFSPLYDRSVLVAMLGIFGTGEEMSAMPSFFIQSCAASLLICILSVDREKKRIQMYTEQRDHLLLEAKKQEALLQISKKVQSNMDVSAVLAEVLGSMKALFPDANTDLYLSQDANVPDGLAVKPMLFYGLDPDLCTRSFMTNRLLTEQDKNGSFHIAAPLSGKQGVYGVLHMISPQAMASSDVHFITTIADSAGSALENAKLYEQSNMMINELRIINEITRRLNQSLKLNDIFNYASSELLQVFQAEYACILKIDAESKKMTVQAGNFPEMINEVFATDYGFSGIVYASKEPIIISDYWNNPKVRSKFMELTRARSLLASPITIGSEVVGVVMVAHSEANFFSYDNFKLLRVLSGHIGLAISNATLHAEVRRMVITDQLTGLYTRHYLDEQIGMMQKKDYCGSIILLDIDHFKRVNDTYGHQVGDKVLKQVSAIICSSIRDSDIAARWGGEELAIYLPQAKIKQAYRVADRIHTRVRAETNPQVTVSCGLAEWNWDDEKISVEHLFYVADMNMYQAKEEGRDRIQMHPFEENEH